MEKTQHQDLVVGKLYSDIEPNDYVPLVILEFIKQDQDTLYFKHLSGPNAYTETDGLIEFHPPNHFTPCS